MPPKKKKSVPKKAVKKTAKPKKITKITPSQKSAPQPAKIVPKKTTETPQATVAAETKPVEKQEQKTKSKVDLGLSGRYHYGCGQRKNAIAKVRLYKGTGRLLINDIEAEKRGITEMEMIKMYAPLELIGHKKTFDISIHVQGGGRTGQSEAARHGIARALLAFNPEYRITLKKAGFLTRDARVKERKKYGLHRARRAPQWAKR